MIIPSLILYPLPVAIFPVEAPHTITIIARNTLFLVLIVVYHGEYFQIFHIKNQAFC